MTEKLDNKLNRYIKELLKKGYSKSQIRSSLLKAGYDEGIINKNIVALSRQRNFKKALLFFLIITIFVIGFAAGYLIFLTQIAEDITVQPESLIAYPEDPIILKEWNLPQEFKQNELITLRTIWRSQEKVEKDYIIKLELYDKEGKYILGPILQDTKFSTELSAPGVDYPEVYQFQVPYLKPGTYSYKIILIDPTEDTFFYVHKRNFLGSFEIIKNENINPCGLIIGLLGKAKDRSLGLNLGMVKGEKIISINGEPIFLMGDVAETIENINNNLIGANTLTMKTDIETYTVQNYNSNLGFHGTFNIYANFEFC